MGDLTRIRLSLRWIEAVLAKLAVLTHFDRWGVRPITQRRFVSMVAEIEALRTEIEALRTEIEALRHALLMAAETRRRLDVATSEIAHLRLLKAHYEAAVAAKH